MRGGSSAASAAVRRLIDRVRSLGVAGASALHLNHGGGEGLWRDLASP